MDGESWVSQPKGVSVTISVDTNFSVAAKLAKRSIRISIGDKRTLYGHFSFALHELVKGIAFFIRDVGGAAHNNKLLGHLYTIAETSTRAGLVNDACKLDGGQFCIGGIIGNVIRR